MRSCEIWENLYGASCIISLLCLWAAEDKMVRQGKGTKDYVPSSTLLVKQNLSIVMLQREGIWGTM